MNICIKSIIASLFLSTFSLFSIDANSLENNFYENWPDLHQNIAEKRFEEAQKIIANNPEQARQTTPFEESLSLINEPSPFYNLDPAYPEIYGAYRFQLTLPQVKVNKNTILQRINESYGLKIDKWHQGLNALEVAIDAGAIDLVETILSMGVDPNDQLADIANSSLRELQLHYVASRPPLEQLPFYSLGHPEVRDFDVSISFISPLYRAILSQNPHLTQLLLDYGADPEFVQLPPATLNLRYTSSMANATPIRDESVSSYTIKDNEINVETHHHNVYTQIPINGYHHGDDLLYLNLFYSKVSALEIALQQEPVNYEILRILISNQSSHKIKSDDISDELFEKFLRYSKTPKNMLQTAIKNNDLSAFVSFLDFEDPKSVENLALAHPENEYLFYLNEKLGVPNDSKSLKIQKEMYKYSSSTPDNLLKAAIQNNDLSVFIDALDLGGDPKSVENLALEHQETEYLYYLNEKLGTPNDTKSLQIQKKIHQYSQHNMPALHYAVTKNDIDIAKEIMLLHPEQIKLEAPKPAGSEYFPAFSRSNLINFDFMPFLRGLNILELAVENNCLELTHLFLQMGFDPNQVALRYTFNYFRINLGYDDYADYGVQYHFQGSIITSLEIAEKNNNAEMVELLLKYGAIPNETRFFEIIGRTNHPTYVRENDLRLSGNLW